MGLKGYLIDRGMRLMQDPRLAKLLQDERVMKVVVKAIETGQALGKQAGPVRDALAAAVGPATRGDISGAVGAARRKLRKRAE